MQEAGCPNAGAGGPEPPYHGEVDVGGVELHVGHAVDGGLAVAVVILADLGVHGGTDGRMDRWTWEWRDRRMDGRDGRRARSSRFRSSTVEARTRLWPHKARRGGFIARPRWAEKRGDSPRKDPPGAVALALVPVCHTVPQSA